MSEFESCETHNHNPPLKTPVGGACIWLEHACNNELPADLGLASLSVQRDERAEVLLEHVHGMVVVA